jgi:hypothetical protein
MAATNDPPFRCAFCGFTDQTKYLANPGLREREIHEAAAVSARLEAKASSLFHPTSGHVDDAAPGNRLDLPFNAIVVFSAIIVVMASLFGLNYFGVISFGN